MMYIAPEVHRGEQFDERSDVYSFSIVMWEMVTTKVFTLAAYHLHVCIFARRLHRTCTLTRTRLFLCVRCIPAPSDEPLFLSSPCVFVPDSFYRQANRIHSRYCWLGPAAPLHSGE